MGSGASQGVAAAVSVASAEDLRASLGSLPHEVRSKLHAALSEREVCLRIPDHLATGGRLQLSPLDITTIGRATPMVWFYAETLDADKLLSALEKTLVSYPVLCGRYDGSSPPAAVELSNAGVPVDVCVARAPGLSATEASGHVPGAAARTTPSSFARDVHEAFVPAKEGMDPDAGSPEAPLLKIRITLFPAGGTAIGMLAQHGIVDAEAQIAFFTNWSRAFRGLEPEPAPLHERTRICQLSTGALAKGEKPAGFKVRTVPPGGKVVPEFAEVLPKLGGGQVVAVPLPAARLKELTAAARAELPEGQHISADDVLTAHVWKAMVRMRCQQLGLSVESEETTTCSRAFNVRRRTEPPLGPGYFANGATQISTELTVAQLCAMGPSAVAQRLRGSINEHKPETTAARIQWLLAQQEQGCRVSGVYDQHALTFIISSWMFDWEGVDFNARPTGFDHGALTPIVAVFTPRPRGDGVNVYTSGSTESTAHFAELLTQTASSG